MTHFKPLPSIGEKSCEIRGCKEQDRACKLWVFVNLVEVPHSEVLVSCARRPKLATSVYVIRTFPIIAYRSEFDAFKAAASGSRRVK